MVAIGIRSWIVTMIVDVMGSITIVLFSHLSRDIEKHFTSPIGLTFEVGGFVSMTLGGLRK